MPIEFLNVASDFFNSAFISAFVSAMCGALAGALAAKWIADKSAERSELIRDLKRTNAAITIAFVCGNNLLASKKQHVGPLYSAYSDERASVQKALETAPPPTGRVIKFSVEFRAFAIPDVPIDALKSLLSAGDPVPGKPLALLAMAEQALKELVATVQERGRLIDELARCDRQTMEFVCRYFGFTKENGDIDTKYHDSVDAINTYTDDAIFFFTKLTEELIFHGTSVNQAFKARFRRPLLRVHNVDFSSARAAGLIPDDSQYADWLSGLRSNDKS